MHSDQCVNEKPTAPPLPLPEAIPAELRDRRLWVGWRFEARDRKWTKTPIDCTNGLGRHARANDPSTWTALSRALETAQTSRDCIDGVGVMLGNGLVGIDIDEACDGDDLKPWVAELVASMNSYAEKSPSGRGIHILLHCDSPLPSKRNNRVEFYAKTRFFTFSAQRLATAPLAITDCTVVITKWHEQEFPSKPTFAALIKSPELTPADPSRLDPELLRRFKYDASQPPSLELTPTRCPEYWEWLDRDAMDLCLYRSEDPAKFRRLWAGEKQDFDDNWSSCDLSLCSTLMWACAGNWEQVDRLFRQSGLMRPKWERQDYREKFTLAKAYASYLEHEERNRAEALVQNTEVDYGF